MRPANARWWSPLCAVLALLFLTLTATPAQAKFSDTEQTAQKITAGTILAPAAATVTCVTVTTGPWWWPSQQSQITVTSLTPAPRATSYEIKLYNTRDRLEYTDDVTTTYTSDRERGEWTYDITTYYKAPGASTSWISKQPLHDTFRCP